MPDFSFAGYHAGEVAITDMAMKANVKSNPADNSLGSYLYADQSALNSERRKWYNGQIVDWVVRVAAVDGNTITLARPLRLDLRPGWKPEIWQHRPTVQEVGIEDLGIEFPNSQYRGHWKEEGYYAIQLLGAFNCWIRRVTIVDSDIGVVIIGGGHNTVTGVTLWNIRTLKNKFPANRKPGKFPQANIMRGRTVASAIISKQTARPRPNWTWDKCSVQFSWETNGFRLQTSTNITDASGWQDIPEADQGTYAFTNDFSPARFFRLKN